ncbi:MAG TPA: RES family NAD+ phosphorylase, partial [Acidimicrobiales bacterium]|nr:RES family NAD+ phosphorylase [Acidimicrobiales bacterium]
MSRFAFRHGDRNYPFFWERANQPAARWHAPGEGPVQYLADTPDGAWAEFVRHEEITDPEDLAGVARRLWVIEVPEDIDRARIPQLGEAELLGGPATYATCQAEARRLRSEGADAMVAPSAALLPDGASGQFTNGGLKEAPSRDGVVWVLFGPRPNLRGWAAMDAGAPL